MTACCAADQVCLNLGPELSICADVDPHFCLPDQAIDLKLSGDFSGEVTMFADNCAAPANYGTDEASGESLLDINMLLLLPGTSQPGTLRIKAHPISPKATAQNVPAEFNILGDNDLVVQDTEHCKLTLTTAEDVAENDEYYRVGGSVTCSKPLTTSGMMMKTVSIDTLTFVVPASKAR
jgi:hypothetical protein